MKFLLPVMLLAATGAHANANGPTIVNDAESTTNSTGDGCLANYILDRCLETESSKPEACPPTDYDCQCAAYQAIATCFNNCPDDPRAVAAQTQAENTCRIASTSTSDSHTATATHTSSVTRVTFTATTTSDEGSTSNTATFDAGSPDANDNAAGSLTLAPGLFVGAAGVLFAAML